MKISWTLSVAAIALVVGAFPAFAQQGNPPKSKDRQRIDRKINAAAMTPFMTPHQGNSLKKSLDAGERMKEDEKLTDAGPFLPNPQAGPQAAAPSAGTPANGQNPEMVEQKGAPKPEPAKPTHRLMGTVCGKGADLAIFDKGADWPLMLKAGDKLEDGTLVISVDRGMVVLERVVSPAMPAVPAQEEVVDQPGQPGHPGHKGRPAQPEKRERYELYAW